MTLRRRSIAAVQAVAEGLRVYVAWMILQQLGAKASERYMSTSTTHDTETRPKIKDSP